MNRTLAAVAASLLVVGCADRTAVSPLMPTQPSPIVSGNPDQGAHPYVGLLVFDDAPGHPAWACTGSLLSSTVVLTAGHCTDGAVAARIWMDEVVQGNTQFPFGGTTSYEGSPHTNPGFCVFCTGNSILTLLSGDVGIVVLSEPVPANVVSTFVQLPTAGLVSTLPNGSTIQLVGYGDQVTLVGHGQPVTAGLLVRLKTNTTLISGNFFNSENILRLSSTSSRDRGGACFGDSGSPNLVGNSNVTVGVVSFGTNHTCFGVNYTTRIDIPAILSWIQSFLN